MLFRSEQEEVAQEEAAARAVLETTVPAVKFQEAQTRMYLQEKIRQAPWRIYPGLRN